MTEIHGMDMGHRRWADVDRADARPTHRPPTGAEKPQDGGKPQWPTPGYGVLQASLIRTIESIEVPPKEEVAKSLEWLSRRIADEGGAGLAAQANLQPARVLALLAE